MITIEDALALDAWVDAGGTPEAVEARAQTAKKLLLSGRTPAQAAEIVEVCRQAKIRLDSIAPPETAAPGLPMPPEPSGATAAKSTTPEEQPPLLRVHSGLVPRESKAFKRASKHDGYLQEVGRMRARAKGSPFDATLPYCEEKQPPQPQSELARRLRGGKKSG